MAEPARATAAVDQPMAKGSAWREGDGGGDAYNDQASYASSEEDFGEENMTASEQFVFHIQKGLRYLEKNKAVADLLWHLIILSLTTAIALNIDSGFEMLEQNKAIKDGISEKTFASSMGMGFMNFYGIQTVSDFWAWSQGPFLELVAANSFPDKPGFFGRYMRVLGTVRFRQLRVQKNGVGCKTAAYMADYNPDCYPAFAAAAEDVSAFGPVASLTGLPTWRWRTARELDEGWYVGRSSDAWYPGSGFNFTMPLTKNDAIETLAEYRTNNWVDLHTRVVFVDFVVYNANIAMLTLCKIVVEFPPSGGALTDVNMYTAPTKLLLPSETSSAMLVAEITLVALISASILLEFNAVRRDKWEYLQDPWHWFDALNFISYIAAFVLRLQPFYVMSQNGFPPRPEGYTNYSLALWAVTQWKNILALNVLLVWLRLFKAMRFIPFMRLFMGVLGRSFLQIIPFCVVFVVVLWTFALSHRLAFGGAMLEFRSVLQSMFTLQRIILGTENFDEMWDTNRVLGPLFFCLWVIVGYFVLSNMFVAILVESISNDKVRAIPHIGVADSARSAYSRWQIWQAQTEETKKEQDAKLAAAKTAHLPGFNVKKKEEKVEDFEILQRKKDAEARLKSLARGNVKELEVSSADVGVVEGRLDVILESLHRLRGTLKEREEAKIRNQQQQELAKQWEEIQKSQRQAEQDDFATHHHRNPRRGSQVVMGGSIMGSAISAVGPGMASSISAAGPGMGGVISSAGNAHSYAATPRNAAAGNGSHSGSAVNLGEAGGIFLGGRRNG